LENKRREALGQEPIANLDELDEEEPSIASNDAPHASPTTSVGETTGPDSNNEMTDSTSPISVLKTDDAHEKPEEKEEDTKPDPYLVESGHILLDLISLEERTAAGLKHSRDT
jgi:carboxyl-terminal processing protease